jgi:hypothetical protein
MSQKRLFGQVRMSILNINERTMKSYENSKINPPKQSMAKQLHDATEAGVRTKLALAAGMYTISSFYLIVVIPFASLIRVVLAAERERAAATGARGVAAGRPASRTIGGTATTAAGGGGNGGATTANSNGTTGNDNKDKDSKESNGALHTFPFSDTDDERVSEQRSGEWLADLVERLNIVAERLTDLKQVREGSMMQLHTTCFPLIIICAMFNKYRYVVV